MAIYNFQGATDKAQATLEQQIKAISSAKRQLERELKQGSIDPEIRESLEQESYALLCAIDTLRMVATLKKLVA